MYYQFRALNTQIQWAIVGAVLLAIMVSLMLIATGQAHAGNGYWICRKGYTSLGVVWNITRVQLINNGWSCS